MSAIRRCPRRGQSGGWRPCRNLRRTKVLSDPLVSSASQAVRGATSYNDCAPVLTVMPPTTRPGVHSCAQANAGDCMIWLRWRLTFSTNPLLYTAARIAYYRETATIGGGFGGGTKRHTRT